MNNTNTYSVYSNTYQILDLNKAKLKLSVNIILNPYSGNLTDNAKVLVKYR